MASMLVTAPRERQLVWLDLFSGLGGASQPALDRGWKVIRVDFEPQFRPDVVGDVKALPLRPFPVDVLWASPPCTEFAKWGLRCFHPNPPEPDLALALAVRDAITRFQPRYWVVENVWASRPWLTRIFGPVRALPPGHALWSNLGFLLPNLKPHKGNLSRLGKRVRWGPMSGARSSTRKQRKLDAAEAAKIPYEIGDAICAAVERITYRAVSA